MWLLLKLKALYRTSKKASEGGDRWPLGPLLLLSSLLLPWIVEYWLEPSSQQRPRNHINNGNHMQRLGERQKDPGLSMT